MYKAITLLLLSLLMTSAQQTGCKRRSADGQPAQAATSTRSVDYLKKKLSERPTDNIRYLNAQARITSADDNQSISANANLIWVRDSALWVNVKKFGLEAARALITRESFWVIDRLNKRYSANSIESLGREYGLPADFNALQSVLLATPYFFPEMQFQSDVRDSLHRITGSNTLWGSEYRIEEGSYQLRQERFVQLRENRTLNVDFRDYRKSSGIPVWFPFFRQISAFSPENGLINVEVEFSDIQVNQPKTWRFEIPSHYERMD
ncbi:MAG: DUF4292 domain-containing protein [Saprospiraceae bacterium]|nr:DUF4292 domain-containing protein [Saprospiraceae bacterium]